VRLAFFGSSRLSSIVLTALLASRHSVACVVTQPDQPAGRRMQLTPTLVALQAQDAGLPLLKPLRLRNNRDFRAELMSFQPEALLTASYGQIIPPKVLELTPWPLNVHPSLLPKLRGASPVRSALLQGLGETGCCIMRMTERLDDGELLRCERQPIAPDWNYEALETALAELGGRLASAALDSIVDGSVTLTQQNHAEASYCHEYRRESARIDWTRSAAELASFVRAWDPDIGAWTSLPDGKRLKIWRALVSEAGTAAFSAQQAAQEEPVPGQVVTLSKTSFSVACGTGLLDVLEVQPENKRRMSSADYLAGGPLISGNTILR
jgi:methionyl-tRNA formyltransferase